MKYGAALEQFSVPAGWLLALLEDGSCYLVTVVLNATEKIIYFLIISLNIELKTKAKTSFSVKPSLYGAVG